MQGRLDIKKSFRNETYGETAGYKTKKYIYNEVHNILVPRRSTVIRNSLLRLGGYGMDGRDIQVGETLQYGAIHFSIHWSKNSVTLNLI